MNSVARSLALRGLHRREVRDRLQRPAEAAAFGNKSKAAAAGYSTADRLAAAGYSSAADRLAAYRRYKADDGGGFLPIAAAVAATWLIGTAAARYIWTPLRKGTTTTTTVVEGPKTVVAAASPSI